jgi:hypothetical protein
VAVALDACYSSLTMPLLDFLWRRQNRFFNAKITKLIRPITKKTHTQRKDKAATGFAHVAMPFSSSIISMIPTCATIQESTQRTNEINDTATQAFHFGILKSSPSR